MDESSLSDIVSEQCFMSAGLQNICRAPLLSVNATRDTSEGPVSSPVSLLEEKPSVVFPTCEHDTVLSNRGRPLSQG